MTFICPNSQDKRHNFATGGVCLNGCGIAQESLGQQTSITPLHTAKEIIASSEREIKTSRIHSEFHELVGNLRKEFGETALKGIGSFAFYLGKLKGIPVSILYGWFNELSKSDLKTDSKRKIFWWRYKQYKKTSPTIHK